MLLRIEKFSKVLKFSVKLDNIYLENRDFMLEGTTSLRKKTLFIIQHFLRQEFKYMSDSSFSISRTEAKLSLETWWILWLLYLIPSNSIQESNLIWIFCFSSISNIFIYPITLLKHGDIKKNSFFQYLNISIYVLCFSHMETRWHKKNIENSIKENENKNSMIHLSHNFYPCRHLSWKFTQKIYFRIWITNWMM